ncbi:MAG TPA: hypothetical protein VII73_07260 [Caulobacteraceae bacterium]
MSGPLPGGMGAARVDDFIAFLSFPDPTIAQYKLDEGAVVSPYLDLTISDAPKYIKEVAETGNAIFVPISKLLNSKVIHIRASEGGPVTDFDLTGFADAINIGSQQNCSAYINPMSAQQ